MRALSSGCWKQTGTLSQALCSWAVHGLESCCPCLKAQRFEVNIVDRCLMGLDSRECTVSEESVPRDVW